MTNLLILEKPIYVKIKLYFKKIQKISNIIYEI